MAEGGGNWGQDSGEGSKHACICESVGCRLRFRVDLRFGETTILSWRKLLKEANLSEPGGSGPSGLDPSPTERPTIPQPQPISPSSAPPSRKIIEKEPMDAQAQAGPNRLSSVIERIERMYAGNGSSDDEAGVLDNVPDDDEYDTNDSFIDDAELDDYFQVDKSAIKHDGFFVNRGKLERIEPAVSEHQDHQLKKRRRKDLTKGHGENDEKHNPKKIAKLDNKGKTASSLLAKSRGGNMVDTNRESVPFQDTVGDSSKILPKKRSLDPPANVDPSGVWGVAGNCKRKDTHQQGSEIRSSLKHSSKWKESNEHSTPWSQRSISRYIDRREGSSARPKSMMLEKAIKELEKIVAESRPPSTEVLDPDNSGSVKKRLPPEIKQKLGKVARLAQQSGTGTIPKDVVNRLMSIVGHLMQVRTLKRNLKVMANVGLPANQEKDDRILKLKVELAEMLKLRVSSLRSKIEQRAANSDGVQENGPEERDLRRKYCMDDALENKICELYDFYAEGLEEDSRPPARRLYEEILVLWPGDLLDADAIKRAIYRAKERRGGLSNSSSLGKQHGEKIGKKKATAVPVPRGENSPVLALMHTHRRKSSSSEPQQQPDGFSPMSSSRNNSNSVGGGGMPSLFRKTSSVDGLMPKKKLKKKPKNDDGGFEVQPRVEHGTAVVAGKQQQQPNS
ncbi:hypothetical protein M569_06041 [Genlisea aurea]|uniref:Hpc2-related domain-containing protein n=1 Tax=Genlisea aurea TaxID=192259 RepID=S8CPQ0_9LAMI|nr:hypothetical protein M569_06041 [Genlisea aurea]